VAIRVEWPRRAGELHAADRGVSTQGSQGGQARTSWANPNAPYDEALTQFVRRAMSHDAFIDDVRRFCELIAPYGAVNGLSQCLLRFCSPGVSDTYQGSELWNQSLVDPDNRLPVDFPLRRRMLARIREKMANRAALGQELLDGSTTGRSSNMSRTSRSSRERRSGPLSAWDLRSLSDHEYVVAFTRGFGNDRLICCVPRFSYSLTRGESPWPIGKCGGPRGSRFLIPARTAIS